MVAGGRLELGSNILDRVLQESEVRVDLLVSNRVPPTFSLIQSVMAPLLLSSLEHNSVTSSLSPRCLAVPINISLFNSCGIVSTSSLNEVSFLNKEIK